MAIQPHFIKFHNIIKLGREDEVYSKARDRDDSIVKAIKTAFKDKGYPVVDTFLQGSFSTHTAIINKDSDFDLDRAIAIDFDKAPDNPVDPKKVVLDVLDKRGFKNAKIKKPCVTADYCSENLHIDFPIYRKDGNTYELAIGKKNSDEDNRKWGDSDPKGLRDWILDKSSYGDSSGDKQCQYTRIVRYLKRWRDEKFSSAVASKIYSIGITIMIKECFIPVFNDEGQPNDLQATKNVVTKMLSNGYFLHQGSDKHKVSVYLPTSPQADIFGGSSENRGTQFKNKLSTLESKLKDALLESNETKQCKILNKVFGDDFKIPEEKISNQSNNKRAFSSAGIVGTSQGA